MKGRADLLALSALMALAPLGGFREARDNSPERATQSAKPAVQKASQQRLAQLDQKVTPYLGGWSRGTGRRQLPGTGWSVATDRRRAKKHRNVARNRAAHR